MQVGALAGALICSRPASRACSPWGTSARAASSASRQPWEKVRSSYNSCIASWRLIIEGALLALRMDKACNDWDIAGLKCPPAPEVSEITLLNVYSASPPETSILWAFTHRFSSERRAAIIGPMSSGTPGRPKAVIAETILLTSGLANSRLVGSPARAHFGDNHKTVLVWMQRLFDHLICYIRAIEIAVIDVVHAGVERFAQNPDGLF